MNEKNDKHRTSFTVEGMSCANCVLAVEKKLKQQPGVSAAVVNLANEKASVQYDPEQTTLEKLYKAVEQAGYTPKNIKSEIEREEGDKKSRQWLVLATFLALPVAVLAWFGHWVPGSAETKIWISFVFASLTQFSAGLVFYRGAYHAVKNKFANMDVLVSLGISAAYGYSTLLIFFPETFAGQPHFFEASALLIVFVRFGKWLEARARGRAFHTLSRLLELEADRARILLDDREKEIAASEVKVGDRLKIKPGEKIPVDAVIEQGISLVDEAMLTGESVPVEKKTGDQVTGATINKSGMLIVRAERVGNDTVLSQIVKLVEEAQADKAPIQRFADAVANVFVPIVVAISLITFGVWFYILNSGFVFAFTAMIAVLVIACPCALGLATPTAIMVGSGMGLNRGILFKRASVLEQTAHVDTVLLDKTGTITEGKLEVVDISVLNGQFDSEQLLGLVTPLEEASTHPVARAVVRYAAKLGIETKDAFNVWEEPGHGISGQVGNASVLVGNMDWLKRNNIRLGSSIVSELQSPVYTDQMILYVAVDKTLAGYFVVADTLKKGSASALKAFKSRGLHVHMVTGDTEEIAKRIVKEMGAFDDIEQIYAKVKPQDKINVVKQLQDEKHIVAMVGDGINDAPALAQSHVGMAIGSGTDVAKETGDVILINNDLIDVVRAIDLGKATLGKIKQNLFWALVYNVIGIPIAAGVLYPATGKLLPPEFAGLAMAFSSVSVVTNSLLLKRFKFRNS